MEKELMQELRDVHVRALNLEIEVSKLAIEDVKKTIALLKSEKPRTKEAKEQNEGNLEVYIDRIEYLKEEVERLSKKLREIDKKPLEAVVEDCIEQYREENKQRVENRRRALSNISIDSFREYAKQEVYRHMRNSGDKKLQKLTEKKFEELIEKSPELVAKIESDAKSFYDERVKSLKENINMYTSFAERSDEDIARVIISNNKQGIVSSKRAIKEHGLADAMDMQSSEIASYGEYRTSKKGQLDISYRVLEVLSEIPEEVYQKEILQAVKDASQNIERKYSKAIAKDRLALTGGLASVFGAMVSLSAALPGVPGSIYQLAQTGSVELDFALCGILGTAGLAGCIANIVKYNKRKDCKRELSEFVEEFIVEKLKELGYLNKEKGNDAPAIENAVPQNA